MRGARAGDARAARAPVCVAHGIDVTPDHVAEIAQFIRRTVTAHESPVTRRPMRSAWWMIPFTACLSAEWHCADGGAR